MTHETGAAKCQGYRGTGFAGPLVSPPSRGEAPQAHREVFHFSCRDGSGTGVAASRRWV